MNRISQDVRSGKAGSHRRQGRLLRGRRLHNRYARSFVPEYDPLATIAATVVLAFCALAAGFIPARRATSIEPMNALRTE